MQVRDMLDFNHLAVEEWDKLFHVAKDIMKNSEKYMDACKGKILATLFLEPSTRTMFSFQSAMLRLGGKVIGLSEPSNSSISKGENLRDTIKTISCYADLIAVRHPVEGAAMAAAMFSDVPVINAGDGGHLHPTQTLTDLTTIAMEKDTLTGLTIGMCGDLKNGRTVHSLLKALAKFPDNRFILISPPNLMVPEYLTKMLRRKGFYCLETSDLDAFMGELDILYMTRIQRERFESVQEYEKSRGTYILNAEKMKLAKDDMLVMHPLPRLDEIAHEVDDDPRAKYFKQAKYGLYIRMALILRMLTGPFDAAGEKDITQTDIICSNPRCITNHERYLPQQFKTVKSEPDILYCMYCEKQYPKE